MSEKILLNSKTLDELTNYIPQHFVYIQCDKGTIGDLNYIFDYDINHISTRFTDLKYSIKDDSDKTIICIEVTTDKENLNLNEKDKNYIIDKCSNELVQISKQLTNKLVRVYKKDLVTSPKTYRMPKPGYTAASINVNKEIEKLYGNSLKSLPWMHTRKEMIQSLESIFIAN